MPIDSLPFVKKTFSGIVDTLLEDVASGRGGRTALTDLSGGSVVRTLMEVFAREMAVCYEQLDLVYRSAYLDTAAGAALNNVVALAGMQRRPAGHLEGLVTFARARPATQDIHIPAGTLVAGRGQPVFATVGAAVLAQGERLVSVGVLSLEPAGPAAGGASAGPVVVKAGDLNTMPRPIAEIESVSNPAAMIPRQRAETDDELRQRARAQAHASTAGTVAAIEQAVRSLGIREVKVLEYPVDRSLVPGQIQVVIGDPDLSVDLLEQVADKIELVRPAGIAVASGPAAKVIVQVTATLTLDVERSEREKKAIEAQLSTDLNAYFDQLAVGESVHQAKVITLLSGHNAVVGCDPSPGFSGFLLLPFSEQGAKLTPMSNGDIQIGPRERIGLDLGRYPIRLTLFGPAPVVSLDAVLELVPGSSATGVQARLIADITRIVDAAGKAGQVAFDPLLQAAALIVRAENIARLRLTVVHEADGRVVELSADRATEPLLLRETLRLRNTLISVRS